MRLGREGEFTILYSYPVPMNPEFSFNRQKLQRKYRFYEVIYKFAIRTCSHTTRGNSLSLH
jgi:hypothetical protein